jgi:hypothetical protein
MVAQYIIIGILFTAAVVYFARFIFKTVTPKKNTCNTSCGCSKNTHPLSS